MQEILAQSLGGEDPLKGMATYSSILPWEIPWTEEETTFMGKKTGVLIQQKNKLQKV